MKILSRSSNRPFLAWIQDWIPQHILSNLAGKLSRVKTPWIKQYLINKFIAQYHIELNEAKIQDPKKFASFHDFFIRELAPNARPIANSLDTIVSPCDGQVSYLQTVDKQSLLQAKNHSFKLSELLGDQSDPNPYNSDLVNPFKDNSQAITIYLAPSDYHRVHMPCDAKLIAMRYIPGKKFAVNLFTAEHVPNIFARNERIVCFFESEFGKFAVVMVGALIVGSMSLSFAGQVAPSLSNSKANIIETRFYNKNPEQFIKLIKGQELGYFNLGSTVITVFEPNFKIDFESHIKSGYLCKMGEKLGNYARL